jgi:hypothetical protein
MGYFLYIIYYKKIWYFIVYIVYILPQPFKYGGFGVNLHRLRGLRGLQVYRFSMFCLFYCLHRLPLVNLYKSIT